VCTLVIRSVDPAVMHSSLRDSPIQVTDARSFETNLVDL
jgi:hypothetical protein